MRASGKDLGVLWYRDFTRTTATTVFLTSTRSLGWAGSDELDPESTRSRLGIGMTAPRTTLTVILIFTFFAAPLAVEAQQARVYRVGVQW